MFRYKNLVNIKSIVNFFILDHICLSLLVYCSVFKVIFWNFMCMTS